MCRTIYPVSNWTGKAGWEYIARYIIWYWLRATHVFLVRSRKNISNHRQMWKTVYHYRKLSYFNTWPLWLMSNLFPHLQGFTIIPDNAKTHRSAFHQETANHRRRRRRRNSPPSSTIPRESAETPAQAQTSTSRWDSSSKETRSDTILRTPQRSRGDDSESDSSRYAEELFLRPCNIQKSQSWPSPKEDSSTSSLRFGGQPKSQDTLHRFTLDSIRQRRATPLPTDKERGVERSQSLQDWFAQPSIVTGLGVQDQGRLYHWSGHSRGEDETNRDATDVLQAVIETLNSEFHQDTQF